MIGSLVIGPLKFLVRWAIRLLIILLILVVALLLLKDTIIKNVVENRIHTATGMDAKIGKFESGILNPSITIEDCILYNPPEFGGSVFLRMPELRIIYDLQKMSAGKVNFKLMRLNLQELNIVENAQGQTNIYQIMEKAQTNSSPGTGSTNSQIAFEQIETLNLTLGNVNLTSLKNPARNRTIFLGLTNEIVNNVRSEKDLASIALKIMVRNGINFWSGGTMAPVPQTNRPPSKAR